MCRQRPLRLAPIGDFFFFLQISSESLNPYVLMQVKIFIPEDLGAACSPLSAVHGVDLLRHVHISRIPKSRGQLRRNGDGCDCVSSTGFHPVVLFILTCTRPSVNG